MSRFLRAVQKVGDAQEFGDRGGVDPSADVGSPPPREPARLEPCHSVPSGRAALVRAKARREWPDGRPVGRGFASPYLQAPYALAISKKQKTVEGRPGGGWVERNGKLIEKDDYINFKIAGRPGRVLIVRVMNVRKFPKFKDMISEIGIRDVLPDFAGDAEAAADLYKKFHTTRGSYAELEAKYGAVAIDIEPIEEKKISEDEVESFSDEEVESLSDDEIIPAIGPYEEDDSSDENYSTSEEF